MINPGDERIEVSGFVGENPCFEVSSIRAFGSEASASEVGRGDKGEFAVDDDSFGVNARAEDSFEKRALDEVRVFVEIRAEARSRFFGVKETNRNTCIDQLGKLAKEGDKAFSPLDVEVFDVSGDNPKKAFGLRNQLFKEARVNLFVEKKLGHSGWV